MRAVPGLAAEAEEHRHRSMSYTSEKRWRWATAADLSSLTQKQRDNAFRVLSAIACHADKETLTTNVGIEKISEFANVSTPPSSG